MNFLCNLIKFSITWIGGIIASPVKFSHKACTFKINSLIADKSLCRNILEMKKHRIHNCNLSIFGLRYWENKKSEVYWNLLATCICLIYLKYIQYIEEKFEYHSPIYNLIIYIISMWPIYGNATLHKFMFYFDKISITVGTSLNNSHPTHSIPFAIAPTYIIWTVAVCIAWQPNPFWK
jgi:hypothetical protein